MMQVHFSVPQFPAFRAAQSVEEQRQYLSYLGRFEKYASTVVAVQSKVSRELGGAKSVSDEVAEVRRVAQDMCARVMELPVKSLGDCVDAVEEAVGRRVDVALGGSAGLPQVVAGAVEGAVDRCVGAVLKGVSDQSQVKKESFAPPVGRWFTSNRRKKEKKRQRMAAESWRVSTESVAAECSSAGECGRGSEASRAETVDTRTAVEVEAAQTLAAKRVAENKLAIVRANARIRTFADKSRIEAVRRLDAARMEERINTAKARSQESFKKCDESMKSLGSSGSAGEYALKQEVRKAKENELLHKYVQDQLEYAVKHASPEVKRVLAEMPPPEVPDAFETMGDCPESFNDDEREAYYLELQQINEVNAVRFASC